MTDLAQRAHTRVKLFNRICFGVLIAFALLWLVPLAWALDTALKPNAETTRTTWAIADPTLDAFSRVLRDTDILTWFGSSLFIATLSAAGTVLVASLAAYALSRMHFRYRTAVFWAVLAGIMIPGQVLIVPWFREFDALGMLNTWWAVSLPQIPTAIAVFIFKQFFDGLRGNWRRSHAWTAPATCASTGGSSCRWPGPRSRPSPSSPSSPRGTTCCGRCSC